MWGLLDLAHKNTSIHVGSTWFDIILGNCNMSDDLKILGYFQNTDDILYMGMRSGTLSHADKLNPANDG